MEIEENVCLSQSAGLSLLRLTLDHEMRIILVCSLGLIKWKKTKLYDKYLIFHAHGHRR